VSDVDPRLVDALREQLSRRPAGAARVGWKYGSGEEEHIGGDHIVGHLTAATKLTDCDTYRGGGAQLQADVELAVELGEDLSPERFGVALEICDVAGEPNVEELVVANDYHRGVAFGPFTDELPTGLEGALVVNGERRAAAPGRVDASTVVAAVGRVLDAAGEHLLPGDRIITGFIVNTPLASGDEVVADMGELGSVQLLIS
jgi:hypothetical protein